MYWIDLHVSLWKRLVENWMNKCLIAFITLYYELTKDNELDSSYVYRIEWSWTKGHATTYFCIISDNECNVGLPINNPLITSWRRYAVSECLIIIIIIIIMTFPTDANY